MWFPLVACREEPEPPRPEPPAVVTFDAVEVRGDGVEVTLDARDGRVVPTVTSAQGGVLRGVHATGTWAADGDADAVLWRQGYHSWSASGVFALDALAVDGDGWPVVGGDAGGFDVLLETPGTSWWAGLVGRAGGGAALVGALSATTTKTVVAVEPDGTLHVVWGDRGEALPVPAGGSLALDPVETFVGDDPNALWRDWADAVVAERGGLDLPPPPAVGWTTWYQYYEEVSEDDVRDNLAAARALGPDHAPVGLLQVDDGWEPRWGDWTANERFPSGMSTLAADVRAAGMQPGLWLAPFYVSKASDTWIAHPDWFLRDAQGGELEYAGNAALDVTHPAAAAWLRGEIRRLVDEGWDYLKLDFLYAGAQEAVRVRPMTGVQAYRVGTELLREAAGPDTFVLACGAPFLPSVGFADAYRTGPDIAFTLDPDPRRAFLRNQVRSTAARGFTNGRFWWIDADALLVRDPFTADEARGSVVATATSGGAWLLGDDLTGLPAERLGWALDPDATATVGADGVPVDPLSFVSGFDGSPLVEAAQDDDRVPVVWQVGDLTALLNLADTPVTVDGPGGTEVLTGERAPAGPRTLAPGLGELWRR